MKYRRTYAMLKRAGFSPAKALEVVIDAKRGDRYALAFIQTARHA
jgi:hypothetical protein